MSRFLLCILSVVLMSSSRAESKSDTQSLKYFDLLSDDDQSEQNSDSEVDERPSQSDESDDQEENGEIDLGGSDSSSYLSIDTYLENLDGNFDSNMNFEYSARLGSNGMTNGDGNYWSFFVSNFSWVTQAVHQINDYFSIRPFVELAIYSYPDINETAGHQQIGKDLEFREYVIHLISKKYGIITFGRDRTFERMATDYLALSSGVNNKFYQNVSGVRVYDKQNQNYMGMVAKGEGIFSSTITGATPDGLRLWGVTPPLEVFDGISYTLPLESWLFQFGYANTPGDFSDKYIQLGVRYTYDILWARLSMLGTYASSWPYACQIKSLTERKSDSGVWDVCQATGVNQPSPFKAVSLGSKFSLGYVDGSLSYRLLYDSNSEAQAVGFSAGHIQNYYGGLNYTFIDAFEFGPLSIGLGLIKQNKFASMIDYAPGGPYVNNTDSAVSVYDSQSWGILFSANQKLGPIPLAHT